MTYRKHSKHEAMAAHGERLKALFGLPAVYLYPPFDLVYGHAGGCGRRVAEGSYEHAHYAAILPHCLVCAARNTAPAQPVLYGVLHCVVSSSVLSFPLVVSTTAALRLTSNSDYSKLRDNWPYCLYRLIRGPPRQFNPPLYL